MTVPVTIGDLSVSEGSNAPLDSESITPTTRPSDYLRAHGAIIRTLAASSTIAAAPTTDLSTVTGTFITLTGAVATITGLGTLGAGIYKFVIYNDAHILTNSATLILLGGANRTVAAGDVSLFVSEGSGNWRELAFSDATGYQPLNAKLTTLAGLSSVANLSAIADLTSASNKVPRFTGSGTAEVIDIEYGTWTATPTILLNADAVINFKAMYTRVGTIVNFSGTFNLDATASGAVQFRVTLPIASNFTDYSHASGVAILSSLGSGFINADTINDQLKFEVETTYTAPVIWRFSGSYSIL